MQPKEILEAAYPAEIVSHLEISYKEVERNFRLSNWKTSELDAGHFVESARRLIEHILFKQYPSFSSSLGSFNQGVLSKYENGTGPESIRILIPRVLYGIYCIRNKRGVGHVGEIAPNEMDANYILGAVKWVVAEFLRLASDASPKDAEAAIHKLIERQVEAIWDDGESFMILNDSLKTREKILITLYKKDNISDIDLQNYVGYKNTSAFRKIISALKKECLIDYTASRQCKLSPLGVTEAEKALLPK